MIDCHSHLADIAFSQDIDNVISKAKNAGVKHAVVLPESYSQFKNVLLLQERHPDFILPGLGLHPVQMSESGCFDRSALLSDWTNEVTRSITENKSKLFCVGECGLDFTPYYIKSPTDKDEQRQILKYQAELASQLDLPLNVHSRSAGKHVISLLAEVGAKKVLLHAFDAKVSTALQGVELGYYFSIPPSVVRSAQKQKLVERIPIENILLETDSPALGPNKEGRNEPSNIVISCEFVAKTKNIAVDEVMRITSDNARRLFARIPAE